MKKTNPKIDFFLQQNEEWREETKKLRALGLAAGLTEELKWGKPCYTLDGSNVLIVQGFKAYCALMFCKGALLKDAKRVLHRPGEHTQGARQMRFTAVAEIESQKETIKAYIREAIAAEKAGLEVVYKKEPEPVPRELEAKFQESPPLRAAFVALTPGRQRAYILFISGAKQSATRSSRVDKYRRQILAGKGMND